MTNMIKKIVAGSWAICFAIILNSICTAEWSSPYCNVQDDGPSQAAFGFPFPYIAWGGVSSEEYLFMPTAYVFNIALLGIVFFFGVRAGLRSIAIRGPAWYQAFSWFGFGLALLMLCLEAFTAFSGSSVFVKSIGNEYNPYNSYRPVGVSIGRHYECRPSAFWFDDEKSRPKS
ncbi:MAG: hypothetical protein ACHP7O_07580 [Burkholderiales bacterium]